MTTKKNVGLAYYVYYHRRASDNLPFYIGKGKEIRAWNIHRRNRHWKRVANKYGLKVELIREGMSEKEAFTLETQLIAYGKNVGWPLTNKTTGGEGTSGRRVSLKTRRKTSKTLMGHLVTEDTKTKFRNRHTSEETKQKLREANKGKHPSEETKQKMSESHKGLIPWNKGKKGVSPETSRKISEAKKGIPWSEVRRNAQERKNEQNCNSSVV